MINQVASLETLCVDSMRINDLQAIQFDVCKIKILNLLKEIIKMQLDLSFLPLLINF